MSTSSTRQSACSSPLFGWARLAATALLVLCILHAVLCTPARAMEPPPPGMIARMKQDGTYPAALAFAKKLGNYKLQAPLRGAPLPVLDPQQLADAIAAHLGESLDAKGAKAVSSASARELSWVQLDLNHDRVVDERDLLVLGYPQPKATAKFPTLGTIKTFALQIDFSDYPKWFDTAEIKQNLFGTGTTDYYYQGLAPYYEQSSYGQLHIDGDVYYHRASRPRTWYHADDSNDDPQSWGRQTELVEEAILDAKTQGGVDFSQYDNDGDGAVDYFLVIWTGPHGGWATFWWGYFGVGLPGDFRVDGVNFTTYSWQWEQYVDFGGTPSNPPHWDPLVTIHETGHALGLPDYYDYDGSQGTSGGDGGLDIMDGTWGDHNCFSKYYFGWLAPTVAFTNLDNQPMGAAETHPDAVICMPGFDPVTPWAEYFIAQNRERIGLDQGYPNDGTLIWHVDSRVNNGGGYQYDNSYTDHKLLKLEQADGLDEIENGLAGANAGDYFETGNELSHSTHPTSDKYDGTVTNATINDFSAPGDPSTADFILYTSNPPQVTVSAPAGGAVCSGTTPITVDATDDVGVAKVQVLVDGLPVFETTSASFTYNWNTLVDFNKPVSITARAWDAEGQVGTAVVGVSVSNPGLIEYNDDFTSAPSGLELWRSINDPAAPRGQYTAWATRASPADPPRTGAGNEACVTPPVPDQWYGCDDGLRSQRIDASGFTRPLQLQFNYRNRGGLSLWSTADDGATWQLQENLPGANAWGNFNRTYAVQGQQVYFWLRYQGDVRGDDNAGLGASIADFAVRQSPSTPPTASFTSPADGAVLAGNLTFDVAAADDGSVAQVVFSIFGNQVGTDTTAADGWHYTRDTSDDDNDPALPVEAVAIDNDGLPSAPAKITVALRNPKTWPASDDFEAGLTNWSLQTDGADQEWGLAAGLGRGGGAALAYNSAGTWAINGSEGAWFLAGPLAAGRQGVDLSDPACLAPAVTYWFNGHLPDGQGVTTYFFSTWHGFQWAAGQGGQVADWERRTVDLTPFRGQSGRVLFWIFGNDQTNGTGAWIDDVSVGNTPPLLDGIFPNTGYPGQVVLLSGQYFGAQPGTSTITFGGGAVCQPTDIISWSDKTIRVQVPDGTQDGPVTVNVLGQDSNTQDFTVSPLAISFTGLDPARLYLPPDAPSLAVTVSAGIDRVEVWADGVLYSQSSNAPAFADLTLPMQHVPNGLRNAEVRGYSVNSMVASAAAPFRVYTFRGDINGDGVIDALDTAALGPHIGTVRFGPGYEFWYDPDDDGLVTEADASYIGYHFGETQP